MSAQDAQNPSLIPSESAWRSAARFSHEAMATTFEIFITGQTETYARQAATEAFTLCDRLEADLSRYIDSSDTSRLNRAAVGKPVLVSQETFACLQEAQRLFDLTQGTFNVTLGRWTRDSAPREKPAFRDVWPLVLDETTFTCSRSHTDVQVDLGGIGKGYTLDVMAAQLKEWGITKALLHGGGSTALALAGPADQDGWPITMSDPLKHEKVLKTIPLRQRALAGSAQVKRSHIIDSQTGQPIRSRFAAWALAPNGARADGLSTAFMLMSPGEVERLCKAHPELAAGIVFPTQSGDGDSIKVEFYGNWPNEKDVPPPNS